LITTDGHDVLRVKFGSAQLTPNRMCVDRLRPLVGIHRKVATSLVTLGPLCNGAVVQ
jgi:hypothetical protein